MRVRTMLPADGAARSCSLPVLAREHLRFFGAREDAAAMRRKERGELRFSMEHADPGDIVSVLNHGPPW